jgi:hypothetical protein
MILSATTRQPVGGFLTLLTLGSLALSGCGLGGPSPVGTDQQATAGITPTPELLRLPLRWTAPLPPTPSPTVPLSQTATQTPERPIPSPTRATRTPRPTSPSPTVARLHVASANAARLASASSQIRWLNRIKGPGNLVELDVPEPLLWGSGWCARTPAFLEQNMARIVVRLFANGEGIDSALYAVRDYGSEDPPIPPIVAARTCSSMRGQWAPPCSRSNTPGPRSSTTGGAPTREA